MGTLSIFEVIQKPWCIQKWKFLGPAPRNSNSLSLGVACDSAFLTNSHDDSDVGGPGTTPREGWLCNPSEIVTEPSSACHPLIVAKYPSTKIFREMTFIQVDILRYFMSDPQL